MLRQFLCQIFPTRGYRQLSSLSICAKCLHESNNFEHQRKKLSNIWLNNEAVFDWWEVFIIYQNKKRKLLNYSLCYYLDILNGWKLKQRNEHLYSCLSTTIPLDTKCSSVWKVHGNSSVHALYIFLIVSPGFFFNAKNYGHQGKMIYHYYLLYLPHSKLNALFSKHENIKEKRWPSTEFSNLYVQLMPIKTRRVISMVTKHSLQCVAETLHQQLSPQ